MAKIKWYLYIFADGHEVYCRGMDKYERAAEERTHGKLIRKTPA